MYFIWILDHKNEEMKTISDWMSRVWNLLRSLATVNIQRLIERNVRSD